MPLKALDLNIESSLQPCAIQMKAAIYIVTVVEDIDSLSCVYNYSIALFFRFIL